jgi:ribosome maturation factor RimP
MRTKKEQALLEALEGAAVEHGFELVDLELGGGGCARVVRVYLDRPPEAGGLDIDTLAAANPWVEAAVEAANPFAGPYTLEVSSPGIDRPLRTREHFARFVGEAVHLVTEPLEGRRSWTGELVGADDADGICWVRLGIDGLEHRIPLGMIRKARVKGRCDFNDRRDQDVI